MDRRSLIRLIAIATLLSIILVVSGCSSDTAESAATPESSTPETSALEDISNLSAEDVVDIVVQRTPIPTPRPDVIDRAVEQIAVDTGISEQSYMGLSGEDYIDLLASILLGLIAIAVGIFLIVVVLNWAVSKTKTHFDDEFLKSIQRELRWLIVVIVVRWAIKRPDFFGEDLLQIFDDILFLIIAALLTLIALRLVSFSSNWLLNQRVAEENQKRLRPGIMVLNWLGYLLVGLVALSLVLAHFGLPVGLLTALLLFVGLTIAIVGISARTAITDVISGFLILADQPFRGGDKIFISELNITGEVESIGLRSTRILLPDNREVIVPNSVIGADQVINYSQPDPTFREEVDFLAEGGNFDHLVQRLEETISEVEGVMPEKPVDVIYLSFGGTAREIRVRWWIQEISNQFDVRTKVHVALEQVLDELGIETPNQIYDLNVRNKE